MKQIKVNKKRLVLAVIVGEVLLNKVLIPMAAKVVKVQDK